MVAEAKVSSSATSNGLWAVNVVLSHCQDLPHKILTGARVNNIVTSPGDYSEDVDVPEDVVMHVRTLNLDSDYLVRLRDQPDPVDLAQGGGGDGEAGGVQVAEHGAHLGAQLRLDHLVSCVVNAASYWSVVW